ncbi:ester cyclase [Streptomyces anulatus]
MRRPSPPGAAPLRIHGCHTGDYRGHPPSGRAFETTGHVTLRFQHGRIAESWFTYDVADALAQVGAPPATGP